MAMAAGLGCAAVDTASMALSASLYGGTPFLGTAMGIQVRYSTCKVQHTIVDLMAGTWQCMESQQFS